MNVFKSVLSLLAMFAVSEASASMVRAELVERGKYLMQTNGCNDCHTAMYAPKNGDVPVKDWLTGVPVGYKGPWGTTYPANLRKIAQAMSEEQWVTYAKNMKARPPMPYYMVNATSADDLRSMYQFLKSLGPSEFTPPDALPPGVQPKTPFIDMSLVIPAQARK